ncbi:hypothetical protein I4U23_029609 [Adineta vaga]|nr:hypothetical protein I4U23_029609 [Adineta vaga]
MGDGCLSEYLFLFLSETCFYWICCICIDNWIKSIIYISLSIPFFVPRWFLSKCRMDTNIVGILLISTGLLYFIKTFKYKRISVDEKKDETTIAGNSSTSTETSTTEIDET